MRQRGRHEPNRPSGADREFSLAARWTVKLLHRYIGRHFSFAARLFETADQFFDRHFLPLQFFDEVGSLLERHVAIVVAMDKQHR